MKKKGPAFERIMEEALREAGSRDMLQQCVEKLSVMNAKKIPVRIRLIAMGFLAHMDLEQLNAKLNQYGCARLYSRSIWEAGLIYAFKSGMSYEEYRRLEEKCSETLLQTTVEDRYFQDSRITVQDIRNYVADESCKEEGQLKTRHVTELMQKELEDACNYPELRVLNLVRTSAFDPSEDFKVVRDRGWEVSSYEAIEQFSACGYFFGREIQKTTGVPVGLINSSYGGTMIEGWTTRVKRTTSWILPGPEKNSGRYSIRSWDRPPIPKESGSVLTGRHTAAARITAKSQKRSTLAPHLAPIS